MELVLPFLFFSQKYKTRLVAVAVLEIFHLYTVFFIGHIFFVLLAPLLFLAVLEGEEEIRDKNYLLKNFLVSSIFALIFFFNLLRFLIVGNDYITLEASIFGFSMFQANYTCLVTYQDKNLVERIYKGNNHKCTPLLVLHELKTENCINDNPRYYKQLLSMDFKTYEIVNEKDFCSLNYKSFTHNYWIKENLVDDKSVAKLSSFQDFLKNNKTFFKILYTAIFLYGVYIFLYIIFRGYNTKR